jgi:hypothetical protein
MISLENNMRNFAALSARIPKYLQEKEFAFGEISCKIEDPSYIYDVAQDLEYIENRANELNY